MGIMKSTPIIYSTPMVQAYFAGRKNQTRRKTGLDFINENPDFYDFDNHYFEMLGSPGIFFEFTKMPHKPKHSVFIKSPYGGPGDELWGKETFPIPAFFLFSKFIVTDQHTAPDTNGKKTNNH
jgi:hypothetical protein